MRPHLVIQLKGALTRPTPTPAQSCLVCTHRQLLPNFPLPATVRNLLAIGPARAVLVVLSPRSGPSYEPEIETAALLVPQVLIPYLSGQPACIENPPRASAVLRPFRSATVAWAIVKKRFDLPNATLANVLTMTGIIMTPRPAKPLGSAIVLPKAVNFGFPILPTAKTQWRPCRTGTHPFPLQGSALLFPTLLYAQLT